MQFPKPQRIKDAKYLKRVRGLPCVACVIDGVMNLNTCPHHKTGGGMGTKNSDLDTFALCDPHHVTGGPGKAIHAGVKMWEAKYGTQDFHIQQTQKRLGLI